MDRVRSLTQADVDAGAGVLTRAFMPDPGTIIIEPDPARRARAIGALFRSFLRASLEDAYACHGIGEPLAGVGLWYGPDRWQPSDAALERAGLFEALTTMGDAAVVRFLQMTEKLESVHERLTGAEPHLRCDFLGVEPKSQGGGLGRALLAAGAALADGAGLPIYLETFTSSNVAFYERNGYQIIEQFTIESSGDQVWAMRRDQPAPP